MASPAPSEAYLAETRVPMITTFLVIPIPLEVLSTAFRLWVKVNKTAGRQFNFDDYLIIAATILGCATCAISLAITIPNGLGRHIEAVPPENYPILRKSDYIIAHVYFVCMSLIKLAILSLYYRIFTTTRFQRVVVVTAIVVVVWVVTLEIPLLLLCQPLWYVWEGGGAERCLDQLAIALYSNISNIVTDLWVFALPLPKLLRLRALKDKRLSLCFLFSIGLATCGFGAGRLTYFGKLNSPDSTWDLNHHHILTVWEPCGGILCANIPFIYRTLKNGIVEVGTNVRHGLRSRITATNPSPSAFAVEMFCWWRLKDSKRRVFKGLCGPYRKPAEDYEDMFGDWRPGSDGDDSSLDLLQAVPQRLDEVHLAR